jgi:antirestriction protein ArdC
MDAAVVGRACRRKDHPAVASQRHSYKGINVVMLWSAAAVKGYSGAQRYTCVCGRAAICRQQLRGHGVNSPACI